MYGIGYRHYFEHAGILVFVKIKEALPDGKWSVMFSSGITDGAKGYVLDGEDCNSEYWKRFIEFIKNDGRYANLPPGTDSDTIFSGITYPFRRN